MNTTLAGALLFPFIHGVALFLFWENYLQM